MGFKKTASGDKNHQGPGRAIGAPEPGYPLSHLRREQSLTPFLQAARVDPFGETVSKYHWTPDLCL